MMTNISQFLNLKGVHKTDLYGCGGRRKSDQRTSSLIADSRAARVEKVVDAPDKACSLSWVGMTHLQ